MRISFSAAFVLATAAVLAAEPTSRREMIPPGKVERFVAIDNVCAWPNLTVLPDGTFIATIFNQPSHGQKEGSTECWASTDGHHWTKRGTPAPHDPLTTRINFAAGLAGNGDLIVVASGWTDAKQPERPKQAAFRDSRVPAWVCRSSDGGRTWSRLKTGFPDAEPGFAPFAPYGDILAGTDGSLHLAGYSGEYADPTQSTRTKSFRSWHFRSDDDGRTWRRNTIIGPTQNETALLHLGGKRWLAAARQNGIDLFRSNDDGETWGEPLKITDAREIPGHLTRIHDGRLLLTYGSRIEGRLGVLAKFSHDEGGTWSAPVRLADTLTWDCGYPSSVQRTDGAIITAYYAARTEGHDRYHMGVVIWNPPSPVELSPPTQ